jgi:hypothetical protein
MKRYQVFPQFNGNRRDKMRKTDVEGGLMAVYRARRCIFDSSDDKMGANP